MEPRSINEKEVAVILAALNQAPVTPEAVELERTVSSLRVIKRCDCGCDSVDFEDNTNEPSRPVAHGIATTPSAGDVGVIVWGTSTRITGLEIYDLGAGDDDIRLPVPLSITRFPLNKRVHD